MSFEKIVVNCVFNNVLLKSKIMEYRRQFLRSKWFDSKKQLLKCAYKQKPLPRNNNWSCYRKLLPRTANLIENDVKVYIEFTVAPLPFPPHPLAYPIMNIIFFSREKAETLGYYIPNYIERE